MSGKRIHYESYIDYPEIANVCLNCSALECDGICDEYRNAVRKMLGLKPMMRHDKKREGTKEPKQQKCQHIFQKRLEINGEVHTLVEWSEISGIGYGTLYMRMYRKGMTIEEAIGKELHKICVPTRIRAGGEELTVREWAARLGVKPNCIYARIERGYSPEQAVTMERMC